MGSECSLIQERVAREMRLEPEKTDNAMVAFNNTVGLPIAQSRIKVEVDGIEFDTVIYIFPNDLLGKEILLGREILALPGVAAVSDASGIRFVSEAEAKKKQTEVNLVSRKTRPVGDKEVLCGEISSEDKRRLLAIINSYRQNVAVSTDELGCADVPGMKIETVSEDPVVYPPYRLSRYERERLKGIISELETSGIIRESSSPYASPIVMDDEIRIIRDILASGDVQPNVKQYFDKYDLKGGVVFRKTEAGNKWLVPRAARWNVVKMCHDDQGHFALDKTIEKIKEHYWFRGMRKFVTKYVNACLNCLYYKSTSGKRSGFLHPIEKVAIPFHTLHLDHVGPFKRSTQGNTQILTIVDGFTKFCIFEPVRNTKAKVNRTLLNALATTCAGEADDTWDKNVKTVQSAINNTTNRSTRSTPAKLLYGFKPRSMADAALVSAIQETLDQVSLEEIRGLAKDHTDEEQRKQKKSFDAKRFKPPKYQVGDIVMVEVKSAPATGDSRKLIAKAKGPFRVRATLPNDRYEVEDLREMRKAPGQRTVVAVDQLTPWVIFDATA
ncbi:Pro-Pol polyprotein [Anthophora plagiata]